MLQSGVFCLFVSEYCNRCWRSCIHVHVIVVVSAFVVPLVGLPVRLGVGGERGGGSVIRAWVPGRGRARSRRGLGGRGKGGG